MASKNPKRGIKRFLEQSAAEKVNERKSECDHARSKRLKTNQQYLDASSRIQTMVSHKQPLSLRWVSFFTIAGVVLKLKLASPRQ
ncbi:hypothetical protein RchiOBHm_Chr2g0110521 [Rosa chinensis]|uniref:Uncharacterized protein n=2 Tax=Rosa chinensis TaxID=74649 RepID=A0A2P6RPQ1_ROSCH|nr:hypothetical protein RchiOBHm_Chr2g0110521 [Rosa chinensis]